MSPTCTIPYEVLFELINDTSDDATMRVLRSEDGSRTGATLLMHKRDSISLVLTAGLLYKYAVGQHGKEVNLSVKIWQDIKYGLNAAFSWSPSSKHPSDQCMSFVAETGVKIVGSS